MKENISLTKEDAAILEKQRQTNEAAIARQAEILTRVKGMRQNRGDIETPPLTVDSEKGSAADFIELTPAMKQDRWRMEHGLPPKR